MPRGVRPARRRMVRETTFATPSWGQAGRHQKGVYKARMQNRPGYRTVARTRGWAAAGEMKYMTTELIAKNFIASNNWTSTNMDPATFNVLFVPVKGTGIDQREAREVTVYKIKVRGIIFAGSQSGQVVCDNGSLMRVALVQDTQTNAAQLTGNQVFEAPATGDSRAAVCSYQSLDNLGRFKVLKDQVFKLETPAVVSPVAASFEQGGITRYFKWNVNFKGGLRVHFNQTDGGTIADIVDHSFHIVGTTTSTTLGPQLTYRCRVSYKG